MSRQITIGLGLLACLALLGGCGDRDPYVRNDVWKPTGANAANLGVMVANPQDLISGRGDTRVDTRSSELAVEHVWTNQPTPFIGGSSGSSSGSGSSGSGSSGSSGSGSGSGGSGSGGSSGGSGTPGS